MHHGIKFKAIRKYPLSKSHTHFVKYINIQFINEKRSQKMIHQMELERSNIRKVTAVFI